MLKLASVFTDNMVLQRDAEVTIWGETEENISIYGEMCGKTAKCKANNGKFNLKFKELNVGGPFELKIYTERDSITLKNILVGDVWLAGGQSNMEFQLKNSIDGAYEISKADFPEIRYYNVPQIEYEAGEVKVPNIKDNGWLISSSETAADFSAVAYHFAKNLHKNLNIPIGIIGCNKGGTSASCWISEKYLEEDESLKREYIDVYKKAIENVTEEEEDRLTREFYKSQEEYTKSEEEYKKKYPERSLEQLHKDLGFVPWPPPIGRKAYQRPNGLYHTMFEKIVPYKVKGVIWYQGEEDSSKPKIYKSLFSKVIKNWREDLNNSELPFIFVQLPMFNEEKIDTWQIIRDAQLYTAKNVPNTSMIVTVDCGEKEDVHPKNKKPVGERLALVARQAVYRENINGHSPLYKSFNIKDDKIEISFDYIETNDLYTIDEKQITGFEIGDENGNFYAARAVIEEDKVILWSDKVKKPTAARYGWKNYIELNLFSKNGLPVAPFNTQSQY